MCLSPAESAGTTSVTSVSQIISGAKSFTAELSSRKWIRSPYGGTEFEIVLFATDDNDWLKGGKRGKSEPTKLSPCGTRETGRIPVTTVECRIGTYGDVAVE
ncbi:hypothetical protein Trydic_g11410 [Trypoxylus dichotomus]